MIDIGMVMWLCHSPKQTHTFSSPSCSLQVASSSSLWYWSVDISWWRSTIGWDSSEDCDGEGDDGEGGDGEGGDGDGEGGDGEGGDGEGGDGEGINDEGDDCDGCDDVGGKMCDGDDDGDCDGDSEGGDCDGDDRSTAEPNKRIMLSSQSS